MEIQMYNVMSLMMNGIANTVLILIALPILGRCSFAQNGTHESAAASNLMFIADDVECLAQMPVTDLMKIRNTIKMMHAVTVYDAALHQQQPPSTHATESDGNGKNQIGNNQNQSDIDSPLRELDESVSETKHIFKYLSSRFTTSTTQTPMAEAYMMNGQMHDELMKQQQLQQQLTHKTGWASEWEEEKPSKVQKVLHYSITALTFLAFAGYLLCMIVQAIKSKGTTYYHPSMTMMAETPVKLGIRPNRYRRNAKFIERITTIAEPDPISMFEALATVSKGYVQLSNLLQQPPN